jgi:hypothetical protein
MVKLKFPLVVKLKVPLVVSVMLVAARPAVDTVFASL